MSQAAKDGYGGKTRHDNDKVKLTNVTKCNGRNMHQGATRKRNNMTSRIEVVCLSNTCVNDVHGAVTTGGREWPNTNYTNVK